MLLIPEFLDSKSIYVNADYLILYTYMYAMYAYYR